MVDKLESGFTALEATVNDLLQFTAHREPNRQPCLIRNTIEEVCQSLLPQCETQGIRTRVDVPPEETIWVDDAMVRRALLNLVLNALDAMPDGGELTVRGSQNREWGVIAVEDTGIGIPAAAQARLFEPFYTTREQGSGLGLAVVQQVMEENGGSVEVDSTPGKGSVFRVYLPIAKS